MSVASIRTSGMVRVTVASGTRRVDLVLPGAVPVAEIIPELARSVGLLDATTVHGGYRLVGSEGRELEPDAGLIIQGVEDGELLTVFAGVDLITPKVYDDAVEAMADVVETDLTPWTADRGRRSAITSVAVLLLLASLGLLGRSDATAAGVAAGGLCVVLVGVAVLLSRVRDEPVGGVVLAGVGGVTAVVAGLVLAPGDLNPGHLTAEHLLGVPLAWAGAGLFLVGCVSVVGLRSGRGLLLPAVVLGALAVAVGLVVDRTDLSPAVLSTIVLVVAVLLGSVFPWVALGLSGAGSEQAGLPIPPKVDADRVLADARIAHEILLGVTLTVGLLVVLIAPLAVSRGVAGTVVALASALVVALRTRQYRVGSEVASGRYCALLGVVSVAVAVLASRPDWRPATTGVLVVGAAVVLIGTFGPTMSAARRSRVGDVVETMALVSLLPLLVVATGLAERIVG